MSPPPTSLWAAIAGQPQRGLRASLRGMALGLALVGAGPALAAGDSEQPEGVLSGPVEGMGAHRKIMPLPKMQIDPARADPSATPAERPLRPFSGWVGARGCRYPFDATFLGRVQDGRISGMAAEGANFDWPIGEDGRFGGRLPLRRHPDTGAQLFQWIAGRVDGDRLIIDVEYGAPDQPDTMCRGAGITLRIGG